MIETPLRLTLRTPSFPLSRGWALCPPAADTSSFLQYFHPESENISLIAFMLGRRWRNSRLLPYGGGQISQNMKQAVVLLHVPRASTLRWGTSEKERLGARKRLHGRGHVSERFRCVIELPDEMH